MGLQKSLGTPTLKASRRSSSSPASGKASFSKDKEKEEGLKMELLEHKMPFLEKEVTAKKDELDRAMQGVMGLEAENRGLRFEVEVLRVKIREMEEVVRLKEGKMSGMEAEIEELRRMVAAQQRELCRFRSGAEEVDEFSSSQRVHGLVNASARSFLLDNFRKSPISSNIASINEVLKQYAEDSKGEQRKIERIYPPRSEKELTSKNRLPRIPKPPPLPSTASHHCPSSPETDATTPRKGNPPPNLAELPPIPPPSKFYSAVAEIGNPVPPPPPPPPPPTSGKNAKLGTTLVRRVPELVEFYHLLMRRDSKKDSGAPVGDTPAANTRSMIGEIENRSSHLLAASSRPCRLPLKFYSFRRCHGIFEIAIPVSMNLLIYPLGEFVIYIYICI
ncbi:hypothetical protein HPP92_023689 [Vanilla planifolia]|uniref:Uncharacterized protein n=1 Tax=Vanilla planifolia TaxID=51239 RepID=A0A835PL18_VANPL|nr:hypothetical protein HPP92_023689 [Vanilla planifolia]